MAGGGIHILETLFKRRFWVIQLIIIFILSFLLALSLNNIFTSMIAPALVVSPSPIDITSDSHLDQMQDDNAMYISQLLMASDSPDEEEVVVLDFGPEEDTEEQADDFDSPEFCEQHSISAVLIATVIDSVHDFSHGWVQDQTLSRSLLVTVGDRIAGATVSGFARERMWVEYNGRTECLRAGVEPGRAPAEDRSTSRASDNNRTTSSSQSSGNPTTSNARTASESSSDLSTGIQRQSANDYQIDRNTLNSALNNPQMLQTQAPEFRQSYDDGRPSGMTITSMPSGSIFSQLGIRQGDILQSVNGHQITTPQRALDLYEALQTESDVELVVLRRGRPRTLNYNIE
jgi:general secretion pathway protein C